MSAAAEVRQHLLAARLHIEDALEHVESVGVKHDVAESVKDALRAVRVAESKAAIWAES